ncbi:hypothetical protein DKM44_02330 [Deinococcus irradiatisoli]|uniref:Uncharacterized protein n=1 Tax=Deinococcus irradiatisoli TaxID=2202254 RepID=A0A2Z3JLJ9_9DEIO|nr:hypothetical protein [Deinococcus irradiatisoli]AWN24421.1 hypothetical protein DKM44_02330 [Deinococcus irradiatisoli]
MPYLKLSEQVGRLANPQRSDTFVKRFRDAVREGQFEAAVLPERFELPKQFGVRNSDETRTKSMREMIFEASPEFDAWFDEINRGLAAARTGSRIKPTVENIEAGLVDFKAMAEETRRKMQNSHEKGQKLGSSRAGQRAAPKAAVKKTSKAK